MRRSLRVFCNLLTILSLVLALALAVLWVRSYWRRDSLGWDQPIRPDKESFFFDLESGGGGAAVDIGFYSPQSGRERKLEGWHWESFAQKPLPYADGLRTTRFGIGYESDRGPMARYRAVVFPTWLAAVLLGLFPAARLARAIRRRRGVREGLCPKCGYDLRATPDRCPECGKDAEREIVSPPSKAESL